MGLLRYGDPQSFPDTDIMIKRGIRYELDSTWTGRDQAYEREKQLEMDRKTVYVLDRYAPPEESHQHFNMRGIPELGEKSVHIDGRFTHVWDVWVAAGREYRRKRIVKPKTKRVISNKAPMDDLTNGILNVTKAGVIGVVGMGIVGAMGTMLRKKSRKSKPITKKCRCKK